MIAGRLWGWRAWLAGAVGVLAVYELVRAFVTILVSGAAARDLIGFDPHAVFAGYWRPPFAHLALSPVLPVFAGLFVLQRLMPARRDEVGTESSHAVAEDLCWVVVGLTVSVPLSTFVALALERVFEDHLQFLTISDLTTLPAPVRVVVVFVATDFVTWAAHVCRHRVQYLWRLHTVHHAQVRLNPFSKYRTHPADLLLVRLVLVTAFFAAGLDAVTVIAVSLALEVHGLLQHSNLRTNFGLLRYVLVTPQSHRVHHSIEPAHFDKNFGLHLSIWDHLFGTQHRGYDEYPATGVPDPAFPVLDSLSTRAVLRCWAAQVAYPFRRRGAQAVPEGCDVAVQPGTPSEEDSRASMSSAGSGLAK